MDKTISIRVYLPDGRILIVYKNGRTKIICNDVEREAAFRRIDG